MPKNGIENFQATVYDNDIFYVLSANDNINALHLFFKYSSFCLYYVYNAVSCND